MNTQREPGRDFAPTAIVGGNCNNGALDGAFAVNLNNAVSNSNWNIGAAIILLFRNNNQMRPGFLATWQKSTRNREGIVSNKPKSLQGIR